MKKHYHLYVLKLEQDKYYVGITTKTPEIRFQEHLNGVRPAKWTMRYKPVAVIDTKDLGQMTKEEAEAYETRVVLKYMKERGVNKARGGDLTSEEDYALIAGRAFNALDWYSFKTVYILLAIIVVLVFIYYFK